MWRTIWRPSSATRPTTSCPATSASPRSWRKSGGGKTESLFRTAHFNTDRLTVTAGAALPQSLADGFHHLFVHAGTPTVGGRALAQGRSYVLPAALGEYAIEAGDKDAVILKTYPAGLILSPAQAPTLPSKGRVGKWKLVRSCRQAPLFRQAPDGARHMRKT